MKSLCSRDVKDCDISGHTFQYTCPMVLMSPISIVGLFGAIVSIKVAVGRTQVIIPLIVATIVTGVWGRKRVVSRIIIKIQRMTVDSSIETILSGRVASICGIVSPFFYPGRDRGVDDHQNTVVGAVQGVGHPNELGRLDHDSHRWIPMTVHSVTTNVCWWCV